MTGWFSAGDRYSGRIDINPAKGEVRSLRLFAAWVYGPESSALDDGVPMKFHVSIA